MYIKPLNAMLLLAVAGAANTLQAAEQNETADLGKIVVEDEAANKPSADTPYTSPTTTINQQQAEGINAATIDDYIKYEPSLVVRRRYIGDPNGTLGIRGSNMFQTARSMVFADGMPLHYLLQTRYNGAPRWTLASPDETESVEVVYGPFSAEYSGNAMGGVVNINTKLPTEFVFNAEASVFSQDFQYLGANDTYTGHHEYASVGDRFDKLSLYLFHDHLQNDSQPMSFYSTTPGTTSGSAATGMYQGLDPEGNEVYYYGDSGSDRSTTDLTKLKLGYEMGDWLTRVTLAYEDRSRQNDSATTYVRDGSGNPIWNGSFDYDGQPFTIKSSRFAVSEQQRDTLLLGAALNGPLGYGWTLDTNLSHFDVLEDQTRTSDQNPADPAYDGGGKVREFDDTGWLTLDVKARTDTFLGDKDMNFITGYHYDAYSLLINTYSSDNYAAGQKNELTAATGGDTTTQAVFAQWGWQFKPQWDLALGARYEEWTTKNGRNYSQSKGTDFHIATRTETGLSPKVSLGYAPGNQWQYRYSLAKAYRFPITEELYHNEERTNSTSIANDKLKPEEGIHHNLMLEKQLTDGFVRLNLFHEVIENVIFNQTIIVDSKNVSTFLPIDEVTTTGIEFVTQLDRLLDGKLDSRFNVTWTDSEITKHSSNPDIVGKTMPRMPEWRANLYLTYHITQSWDGSAGVRYASDSYNQLDNSDTTHNVFGAMDGYTFLDLKLGWKIGKAGKLAMGVDNVTDETAFVHHPWPQRTYYLQGSLNF